MLASAAYLCVMKVQIYKSIINQCIPVDVLKWAFDEGSDQSYWNDRAVQAKVCKPMHASHV